MVRILGFVIALFGALDAMAQTPFQLHGYIQGRFTNQEGTPDRLEIRRARVIVSGDLLPAFSYTVQVDLVKRPYLMDAALIWKPSEALRFTAGQFKIPFSAESLISDNLNTPVARARAVNSLAPGRDTGVQARDTGFQVSGSLHTGNGRLIEYAAGVSRGQTFFYSPAVHYHATAGRLMGHPIRGLMIGADWYGSFSAPVHLEKRREEAEGGYDRGPLKFRAEQIWARDGKLQRRGGYWLGAWRISSAWEALARADWLTANIHKPDSTSIAYIAGASYYYRKYVKIGLNAGAQHDQGRGFSSVFLSQVMLSY